MADTFFEIYRNASLGPTQLNDGEETIVTTNSNTSYVIKDMYVSNTSTLSNTYLELNGFNVGSITKNATGSLIIPPSSTLKIKTTDYPYTFKKDTIIARDSSGRPLFEEQIYVDGSTSKTTSSSLVGSGLFSSYLNDTIDVKLNYDNANQAYWYQTSHDNNSVQTLRYMRQSPNAESQLQYHNYKALGVAFMNNGDFIAFENSGSTFYKTNYDSSPTSNPGAGGSIASGASPYPTSSYPRHFFFQDHLWYRPSSGYNGHIYALSYNTGVLKQYTTIGGASSGNNFFCVSHDERDDKLYIWEQANGNFYVTELPHTLTHLLANQSSGTGGSYVSYKSINQTPSHRTNTPVNARITHAPYGGVQFTGTDNVLYNMDKDGNFFGASYDKNSYEVAGNTNFKDFLEVSTSDATNAEAAAVGVTAPTFGIQLLGVKSTT